MRISDWSSDVCSSDLRIDAQKAVLASEKLVFAAGRVGPGLRHRGDAAPAPSPPVAEPEVARSLTLAAAESAPDWIPASSRGGKKVTPRTARIALTSFAMLLLHLVDRTNSVSGKSVAVRMSNSET